MFSASKISKPSGGGYTIARSVRLRSSASASFTKALLSNGSLTTWTWSAWIKRGALGNGSTYRGLFGAGANSGNPAPLDILRFTDVDTLQLYLGSNSVSNTNLITTQVFRDPSAWYHIVLVYDSTNATSANRAKLYVNGLQITAFGTATYPSQNTQTTAINIASATTQVVGGQYFGSSGGVVLTFDGYMTEVNFIDGQTLTPSSFGSTNAITGVWQPIKYTGTYGTNGFYLNFGNNASTTTLGYDTSGNSNNWTPNNISVTAGVTYDSMIDVPTPYADGGNGRGNYAVMNPLWQGRTNAPTNGNLDYLASSAGIGTMDVSLFSSYWEITSTGGTTATSVYSTFAATIVGVTTGLTYGFRFNSSTGALDYTTNGSSFTSLATGLTSGPYFVYVSTNASTTASFNGGQRPFAYTPPTGFVALNTQNLPTPLISNGAQYMAATTYTGNGAVQSISNSNNGVSFQPDMVWAKLRNGTNFHGLYDSVRGATLVIQSNTTTAEQTFTTGLTAFNSNGFTSGSSGDTNQSGSPYVAWQWKAGGTAVSNTAGSITSSVSANPTAGFSVVGYTGTGANATVGHGLGVAPSMIITKVRSTSGADWSVYHASIGNTKCLFLDTTAAPSTSVNFWNNTSPTSTVFSIGISGGTNNSGNTMIAYCFAAVAGYSAFGSYTGNGSTDGPFVYLGFRPRFLMVKRTDSTANWIVEDTSRSTYNVTAAALYPNLSNAEDTSYSWDILSNGFKIRDNPPGDNASGGTYIYAAFAENPFKNALAR